MIFFWFWQFLWGRLFTAANILTVSAENRTKSDGAISRVINSAEFWQQSQQQTPLRNKTMKNKPQLHRWLPLVAGLAVSASACFGADVITVDTYDTTTLPAGTWSWWGGATMNVDPAVDHTGNGGGSLYINHPVAGDSIMIAEYFSGNQWDTGTTHDLTTYTNLSLWLKWDKDNSGMSISDFNNSGSGLEMMLNDSANGQWGSNGDPNRHALPKAVIPDAASNGWVHLNFPISSAIANINLIGGIEYHAWKPAPWAGVVAFWVDDVTFEPSAVTVIPPPTLASPVKATPGLTVFASTSGTLYDRQSAVLRQTAGLSWVGQATAGNPVTYSFTIAGYPNSVNCEAWMFLVPNPNALDNAPDWNETNCVKLRLQGSPTSGTMQFQYKLNEDHQQAMYGGDTETREIPGVSTNTYIYSAAPLSMPGGPITNFVNGIYYITNESGNLASVKSDSILGTWKVKFTSDSNVTLIAPNGSTTNFVFPAYNTGGFVEAGAPGFRIYLGMQANNNDALNQAVVYSNFSVTGVAAPYSENFLADAFLDTTNLWDVSASTGAGVLVAPTTAAYWLQWTLPDGNFNGETSGNLADPLSWNPLTGPRWAMVGVRKQLVSQGDLAAGNAAFFRLIKRQASQLQVLFPGETNAPNTPTGKTGTPTAVTAGNLVQVTINSVDATYHVVSTADVIHLTSTDGGATLPFVDGSLVNGVLVQDIAFSAAGSYTVTATDMTNTNFPAAVSASVTVQ